MSGGRISQMPARKNTGRRRRQNWRAKFFLLGCAVAFLALFLSVWQIISVVKNAVWDGKSRISLAVDSQEVYLISFSPEEEKLLVVSIPPEVYVEATHGFGFYPFGAVYELGEIEKMGGEVLASTAQEFFATPLEGWIKINPSDEGQKFKINDQKSAKEKIVELLTEETRTNLSFWDKLRLWWQIRGVRFDKVIFFDLGEEEIFADGDANFTKLNQLLRPFLIEEGIRQESFKIEVLNSTDKSGLGGKVARFVNNLGSEVISIGNQDKLLDRCLIRVKKDDLNKLTTRKLKKVFSCEVEESDSLESRSDLLFIIGGDF